VNATIVGAGPAGLYTAWLLASLRRDARVEVIEARARDEALGLGITLPAYAIAMLTRADPAPGLATALTAPWDAAEVHVNGQRFRFPFGDLVGVSRAALVGYLVGRCERAGVAIGWGRKVDPAGVGSLAAACDLLVGADGAGSAVRSAFERELGVSERSGPNLYAWLAAGRALREMRIGFRATEQGMVICSAYPFARDRSTVIAECSPRALAGLGLDADRPLDAASLRVLGRALGGVVDGAALLDLGARWRHFRCVRTARIAAGNTALVGDAAATVYYSFGAGTPIALRSAATLVGLLAAFPDVSQALRRYDAQTRPHLDDARSAGEADMERMASLDGIEITDPGAFARGYVGRMGG
jgi:2-polyprenyl-6-methoxyphenol hydroxylase-like FAD-dependent oxidoreductase